MLIHSKDLPMARAEAERRDACQASTDRQPVQGFRGTSHQARQGTVTLHAGSPAPALLPWVLPDGQSWLDIDRRWCRNVIWKHVNPHVQGALMRENSRETSKDRPPFSSFKEQGLGPARKALTRKPLLGSLHPQHFIVMCDWILDREKNKTIKKC